MSARRLILVIEDQPDLCEILEFHLQKNGFDVALAHDGEDGIRKAQALEPDLILLDWMLPKLSGHQVIVSIRRNDKTASIPIIMLTAKSDEKDIVSALESGADEYVVKPAGPRGLLARGRAVLRRTDASPVIEAQAPGEEFSIDAERRIVKARGQRVELTPTEFEILFQLHRAQGRIMTRDQLIDGARGNEVAIVDRNVDVHISSIRKKLGDYGKRVRTARGVGYRFDAEED